MLAIYRNIVETGEPYVEPLLWYEDVWGDGRRRRRAFDVRATKLDDGFVVVTREVTEQRENEEGLARQRRELERSNAEMKLLNGLADMLQSCATSDEAYSVATQSCAELFAEFSGSISVMQPSLDMLDSRAAWGDAEPGALRFAPAECWALRRGRAHVSGPTGPRCGRLSRSTPRRCLCLPMVGQSETTGVFHLMSTVLGGEKRPDDDLTSSPARRLAVTVAAQLSMAFANLRLRESLREMSIRDPLTGLFNRRYMEETLNRELSLAARNRAEVAVLVIDVDHFKAFNDSHGHDAGDAILGAVGEVPRRYSRISDVACRFGGEEFIVIPPSCTLDDVRLRADELRRRVSALRVPYRGIDLSGPTISCGVAAYPQHGATPQELIHIADGALYAAKRGGRDRVVVAPLARTGIANALD
jgi:diguanylate cyclase (GGDEF)-like protein